MFGRWMQQDSLSIQQNTLIHKQAKFSVKDLQTTIKKKINEAETMIQRIGYIEPIDSMMKFMNMGVEEVVESIPKYKQHVDYYWETWALMVKNDTVLETIGEFDNNLSFTKQLVEEIDRDLTSYSQYITISQKKKNRRVSKDVAKNFECPYHNCYKSYGSDISLHLHIKIKHGGGNKSDRQKLAQQICQAEQNHKQMPRMQWNLPPGFLQEWRQKYQQQKKKIERKIPNN